MVISSHFFSELVEQVLYCDCYCDLNDNFYSHSSNIMAAAFTYTCTILIKYFWPLYPLLLVSTLVLLIVSKGE